MKYRRYAEYKDSGVEWLGEVPAHWEVKKLSRIKCLAQTGPFGSQLHAEDYVDDGYPVVNPSNLVDGSIVADPHMTVNAELREALARHVLKAGDIVFGRRGELGRAALVTDREAGWLCGTGSILVRLEDTSLTAEYFSRYLRIGSVKDYFVLESVGSTMDNLNTSIVLGLPIVVPPTDEQWAIVTFLDHETAQIDALIAKQERLIAVLQEKRQALISHAVTKGLNRDAPMKDSGVEWLGKVPAHWGVKRLKHIAGIQTGVAKGRDLAGEETIQVPYMRVANVQDGYLDLEDVATIEIASSELERYRRQPGDVLMNEGGDNDKLGRGSIWWGEIDPCIHQNHVFAVRPHGVEPEWLTLVTGSDYAKFYFYSLAKQSTNLASISSSNLRQVPILCPPAVERTEIRTYIAARSAKYDQLLKRADLAVDALKERRTALISAAVTGKIDVASSSDGHDN